MWFTAQQQSCSTMLTWRLDAAPAQLGSQVDYANISSVIMRASHMSPHLRWESFTMRLQLVSLLFSSFIVFSLMRTRQNDPNEQWLYRCCLFQLLVNIWIQMTLNFRDGCWRWLVPDIGTWPFIIKWHCIFTNPMWVVLKNIWHIVVYLTCEQTINLIFYSRYSNVLYV